MIWAVTNSWKHLGLEEGATAPASSSSCKIRAPPLTGTENVLPWTRACPMQCLEVFIKKLYEKGYIYKGPRIINWCSVCQTSISDAEVEHEEQDGFFWTHQLP